MNIWILNHYALTPDMPGGTRHYDFAKELTQRGYRVSIFAASFHYNQHKEMKLFGKEKWKVEEVDRIKFVWLKTFPYQKNNWKRVANMLSFMWRSYWVGRKIAKEKKDIGKPDVILGSSVHLLSVLSACWLSNYYRAKFIMEVRDLWPQGLIDIGIIREKSLIVKILRSLEKFLYKRAQKIIILSPSTKKYLSLLKIGQNKIHFIPNGVDLLRYENVEYDKDNKKEFKVMYAGALGLVNALSSAIEAAKIIQDRGFLDIKFIFIGSGVEKSSLIKQVKDSHLTNVKFQNPVPKTKIPVTLNQADVFLLSENKILYGSSNKLMDYMASGKPIIFSTPAVHNTMKESNCGISTFPGNSKDLAEAVIKLYQMPRKEREKIGKRGRAYVRKFYNISTLTDKLEKAIQENDKIPLFEKHWQNVYSKTAKEKGPDYQISTWSKSGLENYVKYFFEYFNPYISNDNSQVLLLDLGCGPGTFTKMLAEKGFRVYGVDYSKEMINVAKERAVGKKINFKVANIYNLPFKKNFFNMVICLGVFQCLANHERAIKEIKRVLKKEGLVVITTLNSLSLVVLFQDRKSKACNPFCLKKVMREEGFDKIKLKGIYFFPSSLNFLVNFFLKTKIYKFLNLFFPLFVFFSHSFHIEGRKE